MCCSTREQKQVLLLFDEGGVQTGSLNPMSVGYISGLGQRGGLSGLLTALVVQYVGIVCGTLLLLSAPQKW